jgi:CRP-like cAMP-binding protein
MNKKELEELKGIGLFSSFSEEVMKDFVKAFRRVPLAGGEVLFREGEEGSTFYVILSGGIAIEKKLDRGGQKFRKLATLSPGDCFGEMAVLEGRPRFAQARAVSAAEVVELDRERLLGFIDGHPREGASLLIGLVLIMLKRLRHTSDELMAAHSFMEVLAKYNRRL